MALSSSSGAARRATGGGSRGRRRDRSTSRELPAELRHGGGVEGEVRTRMLATHQAIPDGGGASGEAMTGILEALRGLGGELATSATPDGAVGKPERMTAPKLARIRGSGVSAPGPLVSSISPTALGGKAIPRSGGHTADGAPPALWIIPQAMATVLESPERGDRWGRRARGRSRLVKLAALPSSLSSGANGRVASGGVADNDTSAANPLRNCHNIGGVTLIPFLCSKRSSMAPRDCFRMLIDNVVAVLVELRDDAVSNVLARRVRRDPRDNAGGDILDGSEEEGPRAGETTLRTSSVQAAASPILDAGHAVDLEIAAERKQGGLREPPSLRSRN